MEVNIMRIVVNKYENHDFFAVVGVPTTAIERKFLKEFKYDLLDEWGSLDLSKCPDVYRDLLCDLGYCEPHHEYAQVPSNIAVIAIGYYLSGKYRKYTMLRNKYRLPFNPPGFHNYSVKEYEEHLDWLDSLMGDV